MEVAHESLHVVGRAGLASIVQHRVVLKPFLESSFLCTGARHDESVGCTRLLHECETGPCEALGPQRTCSSGMLDMALKTAAVLLD